MMLSISGRVGTSSGRCGSCSGRRDRRSRPRASPVFAARLRHRRLGDQSPAAARHPHGRAAEEGRRGDARADSSTVRRPTFNSGCLAMSYRAENPALPYVRFFRSRCLLRRLLFVGEPAGVIKITRFRWQACRASGAVLVQWYSPENPARRAEILLPQRDHRRSPARSQRHVPVELPSAPLGYRLRRPVFRACRCAARPRQQLPWRRRR